MSGPHGLGDSYYELVNTTTDNESQDEQASNYTSDLDGPRTDDVQSLAESEHGYDSDSDDGNLGPATRSSSSRSSSSRSSSSRSSSIRYADHALQNPSPNLHVDGFALGTSAELASPSSIEFQELEHDPVYHGNISVKHTIREFNEEETSMIVRAMHIEDAPTQLAATIRQAMAPEYLSTREPLRILYVGSLSAERHILNKISAAICARSDEHWAAEGMYNICQLPSSYSEEESQVEILPLSPYSIKVDRCLSAHMATEDGDEVISITLGKDKTHKSIVSNRQALVEPAWDLPHIAILYCTEFDEEFVKQTRDAAWAFMARHGVPSIFVSDSQSFTRPLTAQWKDAIDPRAVHMCLESRDSNQAMHPRRLPIDLASFLDIDARQMNRNLTCLTGLAEAKGQKTGFGDGIGSSGLLTPLMSMSKLSKSIALRLPRQGQVQQLLHNRWLAVIVVPLLMSFLAPLICPNSSTAVGQLQGFGWPRSGARTTSGVTWPTTATSTSTVIINVTATATATCTETIKVTQAVPTASSIASAMSYVGLLPDKASTTSADQEPKKTLCAVDIHSKDEVLVKIPSNNKSAWLAKGAIDIDVRRGQIPIKSKLSSVDEGILVQLKKQDAWGTLNVTVVTSRRPKINETFEVNFGRAVVIEALEASMHTLQDIVNKVATTADGAVHLVEDTCVSAAAAGLHQIRGNGANVMDRILEAGRAAQLFSGRATVDAASRVKHSQQDMASFIKGAQEQLGRQMRAAEHMREDVDMTILQAQIASKLLWLKLQGKTKEHADYERKATLYLRSKVHELAQVRMAREQQATGASSLKQKKTMIGARSGWIGLHHDRKDASAKDVQRPWRGRLWSE